MRSTGRFHDGLFIRHIAYIYVCNLDFSCGVADGSSTLCPRGPKTYVALL